MKELELENRYYVSRTSRIKDLDEYLSEALFDKFGNRFRQYREDWKKTMTNNFVPDFPLNLNIDPFDGCNLSCVMCAKSFDAGKKMSMTLDTFKKIIDESSKYQLPAISWAYGGEPTIHKHIKEMTQYASDKGVMDFRLTTNGQVLKLESLIGLVEAGVTRIEFSLDAVTQETYTKIRNSNLDKVRELILSLLEWRNKAGKKLPLVRVSFVKQRDNIHEIKSFVDYWYDKVDYIDLQDMVYSPRAEELVDLPDIEVDDFHCPQPFQSLSIDAFGNVFPCCTFYGKALPLGSVEKLTLKEMWDGYKIQKLRESMAAKEYYNVCKHCYGSKNAKGLGKV